MCPPLFPSMSLWKGKTDVFLVVVAMELLLVAFADKYSCHQPTCGASLRECHANTHQAWLPCSSGCSVLDWAPAQQCLLMTAVCTSTDICGCVSFQIVSSEKQRNSFSTSDLPSILNGHVSRHFH